MSLEVSEAPATESPLSEVANGDSPHRSRAFSLTLGAIGVVFGDIGTSPLYAMREALHHARATAGVELSVLGVVSLVLWALTLIVTIKYVIFLTGYDSAIESSIRYSAFDLLSGFGLRASGFLPAARPHRSTRIRSGP